MTKNNNLTKIFISATFIFAMLFIASSASAQSIGDSNQSSQSYGASSQSDFQNAAFQQSSSGSVPMAGGSADLLKQTPSQIIAVTGAPAYQPQPAEPDNMTSVALWGLFIISGMGIATLYFYQNKTQKSHSPIEVNELSKVFDPPKTDAQAVANPVKKSKKAKPTKKKKAHR